MALDFFAGCLGGCAGVVVGHPFDTIKVKLQTQDFRNPQYKGTFDCIRSIIRNESVAGLYKGMAPPLAGVAVVNAIVFGVYGSVQRKLPDPESILSHCMAGATAGFVQSFICSPMEMIKIRMQIQKNAMFKSSLHCLSHIYKTEGYRGVFRGLNITILREAPGFASYFACYELLTRKQSPEPISTPHMLMAGGTAGAASWLLAYPIDVIKSRIQIDGMSGERLYKNSIDCLVKSVKGEGIGCLFRGLSPTLVRAFPTNAATWAVVAWTFRLCGEDSTVKDSYETLSEMFERRKLEDIIPAQLFQIPEYVPLQRNYHLYLAQGDYLTTKFHNQRIYTEPFSIAENTEKPREQAERVEIKTATCKDGDCSKSERAIKRNHGLYRGDENIKGSQGCKCEKEFSYFDSFIGSLWKITTKSFS